MIFQLPVSEAKHTNGDPVEPMSEGETPAEDPNIEELPRVPMSLVYLEKCDRHRLQYMLKILSEVSDRDCIALLYATAQKHNLKRVCRVIDSMNLRTEWSIMSPIKEAANAVLSLIVCLVQPQETISWLH